jgi:hypothetical protein
MSIQISIAISEIVWDGDAGSWDMSEILIAIIMKIATF